MAASYLGLVPLEDSSGKRQRLGHITKQGSSIVRFLLVEAPQVTVRSLPEWRSKCFHLVLRRGRKERQRDHRGVHAGAELAFLLDDSTKVSQTGGMFKARRTDKSMAALIPGLKVKVEGEYNQDRKLIATSVKFSGGDLEKAQLAEAASRQHREETEQHKAELEKQAAALKAQNEQLQLHEEQLAANKAKIEAAAARFGDMDDYYILDGGDGVLWERQGKR